MSWPEEHFEVSHVLIDMDFARHSLLWTALPPPTPQTPLSIKRTLYGSSQTRGILFVSLSNDDHVPITVGYLETLPAFVTPWIHSTKVNVGAIARDDLILDLIYHPPVRLTNSHHSSSTLRATLKIPAKGTLRSLSRSQQDVPQVYRTPPGRDEGPGPPPTVLFSVPVRQSASTNTSLGGQSVDVHPNAPRRPSDSLFFHAVQRHHPQLHVDDIDLWEYFQPIDAQVDDRQD